MVVQREALLPLSAFPRFQAGSGKEACDQSPPFPSPDSIEFPAVLFFASRNRLVADLATKIVLHHAAEAPTEQLTALAWQRQGVQVPGHWFNTLLVRGAKTVVHEVVKFWGWFLQQ